MYISEHFLNVSMRWISFLLFIQLCLFYFYKKVYNLKIRYGTIPLKYEVTD